MTKGLVQFLLVAALGGRNARDDALSGGVGYGYADGLRGVERDVSVFVVVHIDMDLPGDGCGVANGDLVDRAEPAVPIEMNQGCPPIGRKVWACQLTRSCWESSGWQLVEWQQPSRSQSGIHRRKMLGSVPGHAFPAP